jgi:ketosteroid isomerase-like protein
VSQENVDVVRAAYEHLNRGDVEALIDLCADDFMMDMGREGGTPAWWVGSRRLSPGARSSGA